MQHFYGNQRKMKVLVEKLVVLRKAAALGSGHLRLALMQEQAAEK